MAEATTSIPAGGYPTMRQVAPLWPFSRALERQQRLNTAYLTSLLLFRKQGPASLSKKCRQILYQRRSHTAEVRP